MSSRAWLTKEGYYILKSGIDGIVPHLYENFGQDLEIVKLEGQDDEYSKMVLWINPGAKKIKFCSAQVVSQKKYVYCSLEKRLYRQILVCPELFV